MFNVSIQFLTNMMDPLDKLIWSDAQEVWGGLKWYLFCHYFCSCFESHLSL